jgi:aspartate kinase
MIVMKFGGTSTQDAAAIKNVVDIIKPQIQKQPIIVISAIAQATNILEKAAKLASENKTQEANVNIEQLLNRHITIINEIIKDSSRSQELIDFVEISMSELKEIIKGISILSELTPRTLDSVYCYGELLSSKIVQAALEESGVHSQWIDTKDFMITDENFTRALPIIPIVENRLKHIIAPLINDGIVPVTQGFIGCTLSNRRTTMGRESSDYSASIIGAVLNVSDIQIWTDVDGILTADPTIVSKPKKIKTLSFEEAYELSYFGAKVLHPNTMLPAIDKNIPIHIYNSRRPHTSGTLVTTFNANEQSIVKSIAYKKDVMLISVKPKRRFGQYLFWEHIHNTLTKFNVIVNLSTTSDYNYSFVIDSKSPIDSIKQELEDVGIVEVCNNKGIVCLVGSKITNVDNIFNRIFKVASDTKIEMISSGASSSNIAFVIDNGKIPETVRRIHSEFFDNINDNTFEEL